MNTHRWTSVWIRFMPKGVQFEQKVVSLTRNRERPFRCTQCSTFFGSKLHFERYHMMHQNKRPKRYYVMHSTERPFLCPQCGKSFCIEYQLYRPKIIHTGCVRMRVCIAAWALYSHAAFAAFAAEAQWCTNPRHIVSQKITGIGVQNAVLGLTARPNWKSFMEYTLVKGHTIARNIKSVSFKSTAWKLSKNTQWCFVVCLRIIEKVIYPPAFVGRFDNNFYFYS